MTKPEFIRVYPSTTLPEGSFLPGVGVDGADVPAETATGWIEAGLARKTPVLKEKPAEPEKEPTS